MHNVVFTTSVYPVLPFLRENHYVYNLPIHVGRNVWIGSNVSIMSGITIGDNSVIGVGSVLPPGLRSRQKSFQS